MKHKKHLTTPIIAALMFMLHTSCSPTSGTFFDESGLPGDIGGGSFSPGGMGGMGGTVSDDGDTPEITSTIHDWDGTKATDAANDVVGQDEDIYHEVNSFGKKVEVVFSGNSASVTTSNSKILHNEDGAYVTIDMSTNTVSGVEIELKGSTDNGGIKIYGAKKFKLTLNGVTIKSQKGPAINNQCKKRMFLHVTNGTENTLTDAATYTDDSYMLDPSASEDRKGCLFSESAIIMSGTGLLTVTGNNKHAVATDKAFTMRPGVSLVIKGAAKNGLHVKGDSDDNLGVTILGGYIYANISSQAGKAIKTDLDAVISGGVLDLNTSGNAIYDSDEKDTSSAAGIKTDGDIIISGGTITARSTGSGGKGLNSDGEINISGGEVAVATSGSKYTYSRDLDSSPKGVKADGNVNISGGKLTIYASGRNDGAEGLESKAVMNISGGELYVRAYDDAINASSAINITGGTVYAYSSNNDGIDSNGTMTISGGTVIASGASAPEGGLDVDNSNWLKINGGTVMAVGGTMQSLPSTASEQYCVSYSGLSAAKGSTVKLLNSSSKVIAEFDLPRTVSGGNLFLSAPGMTGSASYSVTVSGNSLFSFTTTSKVVSAGTGR